VSTLHLLMLIAVVAQLPLLGTAILLEFSLRKKRPTPKRPIEARGPQARVQEEERAKKPEVPTIPVEPELPPEPAKAEAPPPSAELPQTERQPPPPTSATPQEPIAEPQKTAPEVEAPPQEAPPRASEIPPPTPEAEGALADLTPQTPAPARQPKRIGLGLRKTRENFLARIRAAVTGSARLDEIYEGLEEALISADVGVEASMKLVEAIRARLKNDARADVIREALKDEIERMLIAAERPLADSGDKPLVILLAGVNGVGKTTTVAKLAALLKDGEDSVLVAAADTFRAAAIDQLQVWCDRVGVDLIKQKQGSDPAAVAFDAVKAAIARKSKALLIDTAGRLQTKVNLMDELKKIARVAGRELPGAPHETWLVLDATTGQNALSQAKIFGDAVKLTGVILAKLDSTAKGGVVVGIAERLKLPVRYVGLGEDIEDLRPFEPHEFVEALFSEAEVERQAASGSYAA
jgi:fused signal recognition particle receptor